MVQEWPVFGEWESLPLFPGSQAPISPTLAAFHLGTWKWLDGVLESVGRMGSSLSFLMLSAKHPFLLSTSASVYQMKSLCWRPSCALIFSLYLHLWEKFAETKFSFPNFCVIFEHDAFRLVLFEVENSKLHWEFQSCFLHLHWVCKSDVYKTHHGSLEGKMPRGNNVLGVGDAESYIFLSEI